jgi:peptidoglycan/xylan/chitin deacetylase (PgdA/CDA1 family)
VLCLDDDMLAAPELLSAHLTAHESRPGGLVQGALRIHDSVARTPFVAYQERLLAATHEKHLAAPALRAEDVSGGNLSLGKRLLDSVGGFNERLKRLRNTDGELALRLARQGVAIRYAGRALAYMTHVNDLDQALHASALYGRAYVYLQQEQPQTRWSLSPLVHDRRSRLRNLLRRAAFLRGGRRRATALGLLRAGIRAAELARLRPLAEALYRAALDGKFWEGVEAESEGRIADQVPRGIPILCYHHVSEVKRPAFRSYILPPARFHEQMRWLAARGYRAISLDELYDHLVAGAPIPPKPIVITFDDAYAELEHTATPLLAELGFPHTHFVNTGKIGGTTDWIRSAPDLPILAAETLRRMCARHGRLVDFQAHGRGHLQLNRHPAETVRAEVRHCIETLEPLTGRPVRYMAYPFGEENAATRDVMRELPIRCSFTVAQGLCRPGQDLHGLPRVEVFARDTWLDFRFKVSRGKSPIATARRKLKRLYKKLFRRA